MDKLAASIGTSSRYAVLAVNVSRVIATSEGRSLQPEEKMLFRRAGELLDKIVQGSAFIEKKEAYALSDPRENFLAFDHAIVALRQIDMQSKAEGGLTSVFADLKEELSRIANEDEVESTDRQEVGKFFGALANLFYRDVANSSVSSHKFDFETTTNPMESSCL